MIVCLTRSQRLVRFPSVFFLFCVSCRKTHDGRFNSNVCTARIGNCMRWLCPNWFRLRPMFFGEFSLLHYIEVRHSTHIRWTLCPDDGLVFLSARLLSFKYKTDVTCAGGLWFRRNIDEFQRCSRECEFSSGRWRRLWILRDRHTKHTMSDG